MKRLYIDATGGDEVEGVTTYQRAVQASWRFMDAHPRTELILGGDRRILDFMIDGHSRMRVVNGEPTTNGNRRASALNKGLEMLKKGECDALYTSGNTQKVVTYAIGTLGFFEGMRIMPLAAELPTTMGTPVYKVDVGGSTELRPNDLVDLALLSHAYCKTHGDVANPRIGLLSNGTEEYKGTPTIREANNILREMNKINYVGQVEPRDWINGRVDAVVSDGFVGNIEIKLTAAVINAMKEVVRRELEEHPVRRFLGGLFWKKPLRRVQEKYHPSSHNGAPLLVPGVLIKGHGESDSEGVYYGLETALEHAEKEVPRRMKEELERLRK